MLFDTTQIFSIQNDEQFAATAMAVFRHQARVCTPYRNFIGYLGVNPMDVKYVEDIPFLPISFFKTQDILAEGLSAEQTFLSSATTGLVQSRHLVSDLKYYEQSYMEGFERFYGHVEKYCVLALLPSYQERTGSSLIYMVDDLIAKSGHPESGYFLHENARLRDTLTGLRSQQQPTILIGVTYALLDFVEEEQISFPELVVMETGGMKGRRRELVREELHQTLCDGFGVEAIHSEYGMTEMLSQGYSKGYGIFNCPPWVKIFTRDINDPFTQVPGGKTGGINVIDLANINSCAFIATQDLGRVAENGSFEVLGRFDNADIRGCNLLVQ